ncbi:class I SAM-dependent methyltransferase [Mumia sp. Pv 4-285]|uniref:class I SAM-dependent methyltransferase n=1 Tax=Mumia qirimensis TaxID=3234852 RepID=UPI00351D11C9
MAHQQGVSDPPHDEIAPPEAWDAIAAGYATFVAPGEEPLSTAALSLVELAPGELFLDVAAGPGGLTPAAAKLGARVVATDWAPAMLAHLEARIHAEGLTDVVTRVMDAHALDLDDDRFDVVGSQFGVMLVPDQPQALSEMVRVTRPGGRVLVVAYGSPAEYEALQFFIAALRSVDPDFDGLPDPPPLEFQVSDPDVLRDRLTKAGLREVRVDTAHEERVDLRSGEECWNWVTNGNPIVGAILADVAEADQATMRAVLDGMVRDRAGAAESAVLTAPVNIGWGRKPKPSLP